MSSEGRKRLLLVVLAVILAAAVYRGWQPTVSMVSAPSDINGRGSAPATEPPQGPTGLNLDALHAERPEPVALRRNLFRFGEATPAAARVAAPRSPRVESPPPPVSRPVVAQIPLRLIGFMETPGRVERVAILKDERGVYHGREGDIIEGQYRILRIAGESVEVSRIDGDTRQVIRLSGTTTP